ncbi:efflux RND transporter periplasmic adaptor subunit [Chitinimonas koreensis]|uniref:efflux RND transporter periplasmic adaptor subunit n=1 Tax=Chitinimonas koreensis TaxID=356302 RepID=UPI00040D550B|nr:efflux RND transporter periplasmic adaptor subunit [Chitinimonas koreensis]QNM97039.1 efflux RND transporter periplasmic adaptor subunit [Chitinimonas koreensis]
MSLTRYPAAGVLAAVLSVPAWAAQTAPAAPAPAAPRAAPAALPGTPTPNDGRIRTQLMARNAVTVSSEIAAKIARLPVPEGGSFSRGQVLVEFECSSYRAQVRKAEATLEAARQLVKVNSRLAELNSIGKLEVDQAEARAKEAAAELSYMQTVVSKCVVSAPFNGRVAKRSAAAFQFVSPGNPILDIVDVGQLELRMIVPSKWLAWLKPGSKFTVQVDELGRAFPASVARLGAQIDPVSQSVLAIGVIDGQDAALLPGMSGWAGFNPPKGAQ